MAKFATAEAAPKPKGPTRTTTPARTHEGGGGYEMGLITELLLLMSSDFAGEPTFYERPSDRLRRLKETIRAATVHDPHAVAAMLPWVRTQGNMRSVAVVAACEYAHAILDEVQGTGRDYPPIRQVVASACARPDEPAEVLGYWWTFYGRKLPMGVKRGIADAATALYNERAVLKYNGSNRPIRFQDIITLTHPTPQAEWQDRLFKYLLDDRYQDDGAPSPEGLPTLTRARTLDQTPVEARREVLRRLLDQGEDLGAAGYTWERLAGWLPGGMDAEAWEAIIPNMGYMATLRNLQNFEQAGIGKEAQRVVEDRLTDPEQVARSRQLPFRFWSAYKFSGTTRFGYALDQALEILMNAPILRGRTLVMVDVSGSMDAPMSGKSKLMRWEAGAVFAAGLRGSGVDVWAYGTNTKQVSTEVSALRTVQNVKALVDSGEVGHGTNTWPSVQRAYRGHDRVVVFTDGQDHPSRVGANVLPTSVAVYVWDLAGYSTTNIQVGGNRHLMGGLSDKSFGLIKMLERGHDARWPWED